MITAMSGGSPTTYAYNAFGQRVKKSGPGGTVYFAYDESGHLIGQYDATGALIEEFVWLGDIPIASIRTSTSGGIGFFYIHTDHLNTPVRLTRTSDNAIMWRWDHDPYGGGAPDEDADDNGALVFFNARFPGQYHDTETALSYNYFRNYDAAIGRYLQSDPVGLDGGLNTYAYLSADPLNATDPQGLAEAGAAIGGAIGGVIGAIGGGVVGAVGGGTTGTLVLPGVGTVSGAAYGGVEGAAVGGVGGIAIGAAIGSAIEDLIALSQNVADTQIVEDYGKYAAAERLCGRTPKDRCQWLEENKHRYRPDQVKRTQKAWGCRRSSAQR
jgi:RHS repeat-associated protein